MPYDVVTCVCDSRGDPKPRFCRDDLFCPQCGQSVAWIDSEHLLPVPDRAAGEAPRKALWVYASDGPDGLPVYELTLEFVELGRPNPRGRDLELSQEGCQLFATGFDRSVRVEPLGTKALLRFRPLSPDEPLPPDGVRGRLILEGNCGVRGKILAGRLGHSGELDIILFNKPEYSVVVQGDGVQPPAGRGGPWLLWKSGPQKLTIEIEPTESRLHLQVAGANGTWPLEEVPGPSIKVEERPSADEIYAPGRPAIVGLAIDSGAWNPQESREFLLKLDFALGQGISERLGLIRQAEEMLVWSTGNDVVVKAMFYGEVVETPSTAPGLLPEIAVSNTGDTPWMAKPPRIEEGASLRNAPWIEVGWADGLEELVAIEKDEKPRKIRLRIDLAEVSPEDHTPGNPLKAEVVVQHAESGMKAKLGVTIQSVGHRPPMRAPLALDFGNTNSYGSAELPGPRPIDPIAVRSVLGRSADPETFPSALAFRELEDEASPEYEIGPEAMEIGRAHPLRLERGLKRALTRLRPVPDGDTGTLAVVDERHPFNARRYIYPRQGSEPARYSLRQLLGFYILAAIGRCEAAERATVVDLGLSYPANLGPEPRRALDLVIKDVEAACRRRRPELASKIAFRPLDPDEASAVALGFVLDPKMLRAQIEPLFRDRKARFTVASFDFGGGSVDVALIRFELTGQPPMTSFASALLGLGGDEHFGGDNVTAATYEILADRLGRALGTAEPPGGLPLAPLDVPRDRAEPKGWANRQALWAAAEAVKRAACRGEPASARPEVSETLKDIQPAWPADPAAIGLLIDEGRLDVEISEIYEHTIQCDLSGLGGYTVGGRLEASVATLRAFVDRAGGDASPHFLILAGASCRVPLARALLREEFPDALILPQDDPIPAAYRPKSKVADGLARFLYATKGNRGGQVQGLKSARMFTHADLLWISPLFRDRPAVWIPSCTEFHTADWHPLRTEDDPPRAIPLGYALSRTDPRQIDVHRRALPEPELVGSALLDQPAELAEEGVGRHLPADPELDEAEVLLRFDGEEDRLRLRIRLGDAEYGDWRVRPPDPS